MKTDKVMVPKKTTIQDLQFVLEEKGFHTTVLNSEKEVKDFINDNIPDERLVGLGDSITNCELNIRNILAAKGSKIFYSWDGSENYNRSMDTFEKPPRPDFYLSRINALTTDGKILMKDYSKQASSEGLFPKQIFAFAGLNRVTEKFNSNSSVQKYSVFSAKPDGTEFTVALLPFLTY
ncbi:MAG: LUD domain-containing protein [Bacteroidales bacterium]|nr:LUD domain-containing protein [Bacteroidales bacterium]